MTETLSEKTVQEKNEVIARFMGERVKEFADGTKRRMYKNLLNKYHWGDINQYATSWDWLMPVVEKIEVEKVDGMMFYVEICTSGSFIDCCIRPTGKRAPKAIRTHLMLNKEKITHVHEAVYQFCKWRETRKKTVNT